MASPLTTSKRTKPSSAFLRSISARIIELVLPLKEQDILSRAIFNDRFFKKSSTQLGVKPEAFLPRETNTHEERKNISLQRTTRLAEDFIWALLKKINPNVSLKGRADVSVKSLCDLKITQRVNPHPSFLDWHHTDIIYPLADYDKIKLIALEIAQIAKPVIKSDKIN
jgi:hypothetical protein